MIRPAAVTALLAFAGTMGAAMVDPAIDDPAREWCYIAKSTTVIGVPYMPDTVQVTFDGALYTRHAELCFFYGDPLRPVMARQKTYLEGWIPIVVYDWREGAIAYDVEMLSAALDGEDESNTVQFVRVRIRNVGQRPARAAFAAATRCTGEDHRFGGGQFSPAWRYAMQGDSVVRGGKLIYTFPPGLQREAVPGESCQQPFVGAQHHVTRRAAVCMAHFDRQLAPGQTETLVFRMPRVPVPVSNERLIQKIRAADYDAYRARTVRLWKGMLEDTCRLSIPEARVEHAHRACVVHAMLATRQRGGQRFQTDGLPYANFFMIALADYQMLYDSVGQPQQGRSHRRGEGVCAGVARRRHCAVRGVPVYCPWRFQPSRRSAHAQRSSHTTAPLPLLGDGVDPPRDRGAVAGVHSAAA